MNQATLQREKHSIDAAGKPLGRLASEVAVLLRGKHKPSWQRHLDQGDFVEVVNVDQLIVTGNKATDKLYHHHTQYPGGIRTASFQARVEKPNGYEDVLTDAVRRMLPDNRLRPSMMKRLTFKRS